MDGSHRLILVNKNLTSPRAIAVFPKKGYVFWTDWGSADPKIERAFMNGENRTKLIDKAIMKSVNVNKEIGWPNGITLDYENELIYWVDANEDYIGRMTIDGSKIFVVFSESYVYI